MMVSKLCLDSNETPLRSWRQITKRDTWRTEFTERFHAFITIFCYYCFHGLSWASLVAQLVKNLPALHETRVQSLGWEDPLEKEIATHSSILAWRTPWTEEPGGLQPMGLQESDMTEYTTTWSWWQLPV